MSAAELKHIYSVPRRFGIRSVLAAMALFAALFAFIRWSDEPPAVPLFYALFLVLISIAQMVFEKTPRLATISMGAMYLPFCYCAEPSIRAHLQFSHLGEQVAMLAVVGGFLAYLGGTLIAGVFLLSDVIPRSVFGRAGRIHS